MHINVKPTVPAHKLFRDVEPGEVFSIFTGDYSDELYVRSIPGGPEDTHNIATRLRDGQIICYSLECKVVSWDGEHIGKPATV